MRLLDRFFNRRWALMACLLLCTACSKNNAPVINYGLDGGATSAGVHTVAGGDTLWSIAQRYRVDMKDIVYVNHLNAPYFLELGDRLTLPPPSTYKVREGDTLYQISRTFDVSMTQLARQNKLRAPYKISEGETLRLPSVRPQYASNPKIQSPQQDGPRVASRAVAPVQRNLPIETKTPKRAGGKFGWPLDGPIISTYGPKKDGLHNDGINIRGGRGARIRAAENGVVVYADNQLEGFGNLILVRHEGRWMTAYAHMDSFQVSRGQEVKRGQVIGTVGSTGSVDSPQLHFEIRRGTEALDPQIYLGGQGS